MTTAPPLRLAVLLSGNGTSLENLFEQIDTGERFVIDSWFQDNGMLPYLSPSTEWFDITNLQILIFEIQD